VSREKPAVDLGPGKEAIGKPWMVSHLRQTGFPYIRFFRWNKEATMCVATFFGENHPSVFVFFVPFLIVFWSGETLFLEA